MKGKRFDQGKSRTDLIPAEVIFALGDALREGAKKYDEHNWEHGMLWSKVFGPLIRHAFKFWGGENIDKDTGLPHVDLILTNAAFLCVYYKRKIGKDNRWKVKRKK